MTIESTAKHLIIRGCLSRYELVLKAASKITRLEIQTIYDNAYNHDDGSDESHHDFIVSKNPIDTVPSITGSFANPAIFATSMFGKHPM